MRAFVGIGVPIVSSLEVLRSELFNYQDVLRIVSPQNSHITMRFIGETDEEQLNRICVEIPKIADKTPRFRLTLEGLGTFPNLSSPRVIWAGVQREDTLFQLADELEKLALTLGFPAEKRQYRPHLTPARTRRKPTEELIEFVRRKADIELGTFTVDSFSLYQSDLNSKGAVYSTIQVFQLGN